MAPSRKSPPAPVRARRHQVVRGAEQITLLASPVRQDLVDTLEALGGEADVAAVATQLGRPADGLYYHFDLLAKAGLLQRVDTDGARRYRIGQGRGAPLKLDYGSDAESREAVGRVVDKLLQAARRDFHAALDEPGTVKEGPERELWAGRNKGWVHARDLAEANRLLTRLQQLLQGPRRVGRDRLVSLSFVLAPLPAAAGRRTSRAKERAR
ncbi:winged helix-turn-helix domain-containing protein [Arenimonas terrae]|uniref:ArsR family transcriptional regulator n=1 Tax=Arenimonas terrae TaxID=2546226 RepID=A0A5C4RVI3_9GAMM|nr:helix-turn-helix domain-containing protein [Arenimonas terrae]TNJ35018.1 ArsR family transcriptional regulator [Arenimonas terrae]